MGEWLLRHTPGWIAPGLWGLGMIIFGSVVLLLGYIFLDVGYEVLYPEESDVALGTRLVGLIGTIVVAVIAGRLGYGWWRELRRWREVARRS